MWLATAAGVAAALAAGRLTKGMLFGVAPAGALRIASAAVVLILIALLSGLLPARRACRIDPMRALRFE